MDALDRDRKIPCDSALKTMGVANWCPELDPHLHHHLIHNKGATAVWWRKDDPSNKNGIASTGLN